PLFRLSVTCVWSCGLWVRFSLRAPHPHNRIANFLRSSGSTAALTLAIATGCYPNQAHAQAPSAAYLTDNQPETMVSAFIAEASVRFNLPAPWIQSVMAAESTGNPRAVSPKGAMGLMQIMPETWSDLRRRYHLGTDPYDPHDNIIAGTGYLREMFDHYGVSGFLAAYNAGPSRW